MLDYIRLLCEQLSDAEYARRLPAQWDPSPLAQAHGSLWDPLFQSCPPRVHSAMDSIDDYGFRMAIAPALNAVAAHPRLTYALRLCREFMDTYIPGTWDSLQATYAAYPPGNVPQ